jgi:hypothetical protein
MCARARVCVCACVCVRVYGGRHVLPCSPGWRLPRAHDGRWAADVPLTTIGAIAGDCILFSGGCALCACRLIITDCAVHITATDLTGHVHTVNAETVYGCCVGRRSVSLSDGLTALRCALFCSQRSSCTPRCHGAASRRSAARCSTSSYRSACTTRTRWVAGSRLT